LEEDDDEEEEEEGDDDDTSKRIKSAYPSVVNDNCEPAAATRAPFLRVCVNTGAGGGRLELLVVSAAAAAAAALTLLRAVGVGGHPPDTPM